MSGPPVEAGLAKQILETSYRLRHQGREVTDRELDGLTRAAQDAKQPNAVLAKLAVSAACFGDGTDWPQHMRLAAMAVYDLQDAP